MSALSATAPDTRKETLAWRERFDAVEGLLPGAGSPWMRDLRRAAIEHFQEAGIPTSRAEDWRYFGEVKALAGANFRSAAGGRLAREVEKTLLGYLLPGAGTRRIVFVNGSFAPAVSDVGALPPGVRAGSLAAFLNSVPEIVEPHFGSAAAAVSDPLVALNTAFQADGFFLHLAKGAVLEEPLHLVFLSEPAHGPSMTHPRCLIVAGENSRASIIESFLGPAIGPYLTNAVTEIILGDGARIDHTKIQEEGAEALHIASTRIRQGRDTILRSRAVMLGGHAARNAIATRLEGPGGSCELDGLFFAQGTQVMDHPTVIDHVAAHCTSREAYKSVLDDQATGSFTGRIIVRPDAQKTDAAQQSRNLLLSDEATVNARPQLEIDADDVKCSHGATSGQLDKDAIFYLRARGIDAESARRILMRAFVNEIIDRIDVPALREHLHSRLDGRVGRGKKPKESV